MTADEQFELLLAEHTGLLTLEVQRFRDRSRRLLDPANIERLEFDDLMQVCQLALWRAMDKFDPERGNKFSSYLGGACRKSLANFARQTLPKVRTGPNGNSWEPIMVSSFDEFDPYQQDSILSGVHDPRRIHRKPGLQFEDEL